MSKLLRKLYLLGFIACLVLAYFGFQMAQAMHRSSPLTEVVSVELNKGESVRTLAKKLKTLGLIEQHKYFVVWARLTGAARRLQAGEYTITADSSLADLLDDMVAGRVRQYPLTLVEGWNFKQFMDAINHHAAVKTTLVELKPEAVMSKLGFENEHPEGRFFPDTYFIHKNITDVEILQRAHQIMAQHLERLWETRDSGLPFKTPYEALVLASIVEKESAAKEERPVIAGVFINRLRMNMRLQTDPTVIYGMGDRYDGDIRFRDLRQDTPYNTYTRKGLPPTPIAMPSLGALQAVMHPEQTDYIYFVAIGDGSGRHAFSRTNAEHEKYVDRYQRKK